MVWWLKTWDKAHKAIEKQKKLHRQKARLQNCNRIQTLMTYFTWRKITNSPSKNSSKFIPSTQQLYMFLALSNYTIFQFWLKVRMLETHCWLVTCINHTSSPNLNFKSKICHTGKKKTFSQEKSACSPYMISKIFSVSKLKISGKKSSDQIWGQWCPTNHTLCSLLSTKHLSLK